jgi:hypothetical protein
VQRSSTPKLLQWLWFSMRNSECSNFLFFRNLKFQWVESYSSFTLSASVVNAQQELKRCPKVTTNSEKGDYKKRGRTICERALRLQAFYTEVLLSDLSYLLSIIYKHIAIP